MNNIWGMAKPEEQGMDSIKLSEMINYVVANNKDIHSILVIRNQNIVTEVSFYPYESNLCHDIYSCSKSITSMLLGIAIEDGLIKSIKDSILSYFPEVHIKEDIQNKHKITIENLLTMSSGLDWDEFGDYDNFWDSEDQLEYFFNKKMKDEPGKIFNYCSAVPHIFQLLLDKVTGEDNLDYAKRKLFEPLGISEVYWPMAENRLRSGILLKPRDMAKIGCLFLNKGKWLESQIISERWIEKSTSKHIETPNDISKISNFGAGYGYQWWLNSFGGFHANGFGGQYMFVIPASDLVVVFTASLFGQDFYLPQVLTEKYIIGALTPTSQLSLHQRTHNLHQETIDKSNTLKQVKPLNNLPTIAKVISSKTYVFENSFKSETLYKTEELINEKVNEINCEDCISKISFKFDESFEAVLKITEKNVTQELLVGLDDKERINYSQVFDTLEDLKGNNIGLKGKWINDKTFCLIIRYLYNAEVIHINYTFENHEVIKETFFLGRIIENTIGFCN